VNLGELEAAMLATYTARYVRIDSGYMGQLVEWPEVVTEGADLDDCRASLRDALEQMILAYRQMGKDLPAPGGLLEQLGIEVDDVRQTA
jgi:predicted RNase H-like HicB family nuclease